MRTYFGVRGSTMESFFCMVSFEFLEKRLQAEGHTEVQHLGVWVGSLVTSLGISGEAI